MTRNIKTVVSDECYTDLEKLKAQLSAVSNAELLRIALRELLNKYREGL